ncbi:hypothetical protein ACEQ8H_007387 [Pleosporales sp. CAS-2024a]
MLHKVVPVGLFISTQVILAYATLQNTDSSRTIHTEVVIIGGGATGTYAAVRLREDLNTSVMLVEPKDHLGGSVSTYTVPETNTTVEYGVQSYVRNQAAMDFYARFGVKTQPSAARRLTTVNVDVETGAQLKEYLPPTSLSLNPDTGDFLQAQDIPTDLLTRVEDFVAKHHLEAAVPRIEAISGIGYGGIRHLLTFNLMQAFGATLTRQVLDNELLVPVGSNSLIYQRALALLADDVLLSTTIRHIERDSERVHLLVSKGDEKYTIHAKRILFTAPPSLSALAPYKLDAQEEEVFQQWTVDGQWIGVARIDCIHENYSINYIPSAAVPNNQLSTKEWPFSLRLDSTGPPGLNLFRVVMGANYTISSEEYKRLVVEGVQKISQAGTVECNCTVDFEAMSDHTRPVWKQSAEQLQAGFVQDLYALQGHRGMWYTGSVWGAPYSSTLWNFTDTVLPKLLADIGQAN